MVEEHYYYMFIVLLFHCVHSLPRFDTRGPAGSSCVYGTSTEEGQRCIPGSNTSETPKKKPCTAADHANLTSSFTTATAVEMLYFSIYCPLDGNKLWKFNGEPKPSWKDNPHVINPTFVRHSGNYSCEVQRQNNTEERTVFLYVPRKLVCEKPKYPKLKPSDKQFAKSGERVTWHCSANVGYPWSGSNYSLIFFKQTETGKRRRVTPNNKTSISVQLNSDGNLTGTISFVAQASSYGKYVCEVTNYGYVVSQEFDLIYGVTPHLQTVGNLRAFVLVVFAYSVVLLLVISWWTMKPSLTLIISQYHSPADNKDDAFVADVCIIHAQDADDWVFEYLLPTIEKDFGYSCYVPLRDMKGGQVIIGHLTEVLPKSRRIMVVITRLLLDTEWAVFATYYAVNDVVRWRGSVVCILLQKFTRKCCCFTGNAENVNLATALKLFTMIPFPLSHHNTSVPTEQLKPVLDCVMYIRGLRKKSFSRKKFPPERRRTYKNMWRLLWVNLIMLFKRSAEQRFWFHVLLSLPDKKLKLSPLMESKELLAT